MNIHGFNIKLSYESSLWTASLKMAAERYLSRRIPDLRVGNNIDEIDKKLIPASIHPWVESFRDGVTLSPRCKMLGGALHHTMSNIVTKQNLPEAENLPHPLWTPLWTCPSERIGTAILTIFDVNESMIDNESGYHQKSKNLRIFNV